MKLEDSRCQKGFLLGFGFVLVVSCVVRLLPLDSQESVLWAVHSEGEELLQHEKLNGQSPDVRAPPVHASPVLCTSISRRTARSGRSREMRP
eukprot:scaffold101775_cov69-Phaeocystis_antarctica.AAC.1